MVGVTVKADIGRAREVLDRYEKLFASPRLLMESAGAILENNVRARFQSGHGPGGVPWPPSNRQRYAARPGGKGKGRSKVGPNRGGKTLVNTGGLLNSITHVADDRRVEVGVIAKTESAKYGYVHQFGATIVPKSAPYLAFPGPDGHLVFVTRVVIPKRPFIGIDDEDRRDLIAAWEAVLEAQK